MVEFYLLHPLQQLSRCDFSTTVLDSSHIEHSETAPGSVECQCLPSGPWLREAPRPACDHIVQHSPNTGLVWNRWLADMASNNIDKNNWRIADGLWRSALSSTIAIGWPLVTDWWPHSELVSLCWASLSDDLTLSASYFPSFKRLLSDDLTLC